ncbi:MAG: hypothetical protein ACK5IJ_06735 [Mangrovibacterium sp.]
MKNIYLIVLLLFCFVSCKTTQKITQTHVNEKELYHEPFKKVCVLAMVANPDLKDRIESRIVKSFESHGMEAIASREIIENKLISLKNVDKQHLDSILTAAGCDALFTVSVVDTKKESIYVRNDSDSKTPNFSYVYYNDYQSYFSYRNSEMNHDSKVLQESTYVIESIMYDVKTNHYVWSVQSEALQPSSVKSWVRSYSKQMVEQLHEMVNFQE